MTDKVQLIKQEIESIEQILDDINKTHNDPIDNGIISAKKNICKQIKSFIDSIPDEPASEDLEEAARKYLLYKHISPLNEILHQADLKVEIQYHKDIEESFKAGAEWQKQQFMKDSIEAQVYPTERPDLVEICQNGIILGGTEFKPGDKVKIIIIKKE